MAESDKSGRRIWSVSHQGMECPKCGFKLRSGQAFCTNCGADVAEVWKSVVSNGTDLVGFWERAGAYLIDAIILFIIWLVVVQLFSDLISYNVVGYLLPAVATIAFWQSKSATPGKMAISAIIVDAKTGRKPSLGQYIGRYLGYILSGLPLGLGFFWVGWDKKKQGWHDKLAGTLVIKKTRPSPTVPHIPPPVKKAKKKVTPTAPPTPPTPAPTPKPRSGSDCPECGSPWDGNSCSICGHSLRQTLSLAKEDGQAIAMGLLKLDLNQAWAKRKLGEDGQFWDKNLQFSLEPRNQNWVVIPNPSATNETMVDGVVMTSEVILIDGMVLSVGKQAKGIQKTPLIVRLA